MQKLFFDSALRERHKFKMADREIEDAPAKYKSRVWQYFGFEKTVDNGVKSVNKTKTVCKVCQSDISYATVCQFFSCKPHYMFCQILA